MRGGTSKGVCLLASDLPTHPAARHRVLLAIMGSPDPRQIDGLSRTGPLRIDKRYVHTYYAVVNVTLSIDDEVVQEARRRAEAMGTSVNQLIREYLEQFTGKTDRDAAASESERLSRASQGNSRGWRCNRDELHERR